MIKASRKCWRTTGGEVLVRKHRSARHDKFVKRQSASREGSGTELIQGHAAPDIGGDIQILTFMDGGFAFIKAAF